MVHRIAGVIHGKQLSHRVNSIFALQLSQLVHQELRIIWVFITPHFQRGMVLIRDWVWSLTITNTITTRTKFICNHLE